MFHFCFLKLLSYFLKLFYVTYWVLGKKKMSFLLYNFLNFWIFHFWNVIYFLMFHFWNRCTFWMFDFLNFWFFECLSFEDSVVFHFWYCSWWHVQLRQCETAPRATLPHHPTCSPPSHSFWFFHYWNVWIFEIFESFAGPFCKISKIQTFQKSKNGTVRKAGGGHAASSSQSSQVSSQNYVAEQPEKPNFKNEKHEVFKNEKWKNKIVSKMKDSKNPTVSKMKKFKNSKKRYTCFCEETRRRRRRTRWGDVKARSSPVNERLLPFPFQPTPGPGRSRSSGKRPEGRMTSESRGPSPGEGAGGRV